MARTIYICLLCGWLGPVRTMEKDADGTDLRCPICHEPTHFMMDLSEPPQEFLAMHKTSFLPMLEERRQEMQIEPSPQLQEVLLQLLQARGVKA